MVEGSLVMMMMEAASGDTSKDELTAEVRLTLDAVRLYPVPALSIRKSVKVAIPFTAATVDVPAKVAPTAPVPEVMLTVTELVAEVTVFPSRSLITTIGWVAKLLPAVAPDGCVEKDRLVGTL